MKKFLVMLVCMCAFATASYAQQGQGMAGINLLYGNDTNIGLGVKYRYGLTDNLRIEPHFNYFFKHDYFSMWDLGANFHYVFPVAETVGIYPLAGLAYSNGKAHGSDFGGEDVSDGKISINLGCGADFQMASNITLSIEAKYQIIDNVNQLVVAAGVAFAF